MSAREIQRLIRGLAEDNTSGAVELTRRAAEVLALVAQETKPRGLSGFLVEVLDAGKQLLEAQPSMAPVFSLVNGLLWRLDPAEDEGEARDITEQVARKFAADLSKRRERIAKEATALLADGARVMTHSSSSTVIRALLMARAQGRRVQAICTESRPMQEGREVVKALAEVGIEATLIVDCAAPDLVRRADLVVVGADTVSRQGLVNKVGTYGIAVAADANGIPFYALCGTEKFLPPDYPFFEIERKDPREVWDECPEGVEVLNYYFDVTPLSCISGIVTEEGILAAEQVEERLARLKVHRALAGRSGREGPNDYD